MLFAWQVGIICLRLKFFQLRLYDLMELPTDSGGSVSYIGNSAGSHASAEESVRTAVRTRRRLIQRFKNRAITVLCTGTLKGVQLVHSDGQAVVKPSHPQQGEGKDIAIKNLNTFYLYLLSARP